MPLLESAFPAFVVNLCTSPLGITGAITSLQSMGDTPASMNLFAAYAQQLSEWGTTVPGQPSTAALSPLTSFCLGEATLQLSAAGVATG